jgi:hypothetical protein
MKIAREGGDLPRSDYTNNKVKVCHNTEGLKVVTARNTNVHTHAAITNILIVGQYGKDMGGPMSQVGDAQ